MCSKKPSDYGDNCSILSYILKWYTEEEKKDDPSKLINTFPLPKEIISNISYFLEDNVLIIERNAIAGIGKGCTSPGRLVKIPFEGDCSLQTTHGGISFKKLLRSINASETDKNALYTEKMVKKVKKMVKDRVHYKIARLISNEDDSHYKGRSIFFAFFNMKDIKRLLSIKVEVPLKWATSISDLEIDLESLLRRMNPIVASVDVNVSTSTLLDDVTTPKSGLEIDDNAFREAMGSVPGMFSSNNFMEFYAYGAPDMEHLYELPEVERPQKRARLDTSAASSA